jgi:hypothetical protein
MEMPCLPAGRLRKPYSKQINNVDFNFLKQLETAGKQSLAYL